MTVPAVDKLTLRLREGVEALGLQLDMPAQSRLRRHVELVSQWSRVYNLTAVRDVDDMVELHVLDSLAAVLPLRRYAAGAALSLLDVGSGAGFPGVPLAVAMPDCNVTCIDAVAKKAAFVQQVQGELGLTNLASVHGRVEGLDPKPWDVIISRAFATLQDFVEWTGALLAADGCWMAMKAKLPEAEMAAMPADIEVFHVEQLDVPGLAASRCLIWMRKRAN